MARVSPEVLEPALAGSGDPLATDLLRRLRGQREPPTTKATRPVPQREALAVYRRKAAQGDRSHVRTEGYPAFLEALARAPDADVIVHGLAFAEVVYLVLTDRTRTRCIGVLRKARLRTEEA
jgi:hypothetical protein